MKIAQTALALILLVALVYFVGGQALLAVFFDLELIYILALLALSVVLIWASCLKWQLFVTANGGEVSLLYLMKIYTVSYFFNLFAPSYLGGDAARSYQLGKTLGSQSNAFAATFLERFTGLFAMCSLALAFVLLGASETAGVSLSVFLISGIVYLSALPCFSPYFAQKFFDVLRGLLARAASDAIRSKCEGVLEKLDRGMAYARGNTTLFIKALAYSFLFHVLTVINTYVACRAVGWDNPQFYGLFVVVPLILLVGMLPLTPNGVGLQEGAFVFFLQRIGSSASQGLAVGLVLRAKVIILAMIGGLIFLKMRSEQVEK